MKRRLATVAIFLGLTSVAHAVEWSSDVLLRETLELSDNPFQQTLARWGLGSYSSIAGNLTGQTKTSRFDLNADFSYTKYWGPAAETNNALSETNNSGVFLRYETKGKVPGDRNYITASWRRQSTATAIFENLGVPTNASGSLSTLTAQGGIERALTSTDFWTLSARATQNAFDTDNGFLDVATTTTFRHQSNRTSAITALNEVERLKYDNLPNTNIFIWRYMAGLDLKPYQNVSFVFSAGAATVFAEHGEPQTGGRPAVGFPVSNISSGFIGNAEFTYKFLPTTELFLFASRSLSPSVVGALTNSERVGASVRHTINQKSSLLVGVDLSRLTTASAQTDFLAANATYNRSLARDWDFALTYRYLHRGATSGPTNLTLDPITGAPILLTGSNTGSASSNTIIMMLSKRFVILPKRT